MNRVPVDESRLGGLTAIGVSPKTDPSGAQKKNFEGVLQWVVEFLHRQEGQRSEVLQVTFTALQEPTLPTGPVRLDGMYARHWDMNGRSGLSFDAERVVASTSPGGTGTKSPGKESD